MAFTLNYIRFEDFSLFIKFECGVFPWIIYNGAQKLVAGIATTKEEASDKIKTAIKNLQNNLIPEEKAEEMLKLWINETNNYIYDDNLDD